MINITINTDTYQIELSQKVLSLHQNDVCVYQCMYATYLDRTANIDRLLYNASINEHWDYC